MMPAFVILPPSMEIRTEYNLRKLFLVEEEIALIRCGFFFNFSNQFSVVALQFELFCAVQHVRAIKSADAPWTTRTSI